jgi:hypothetical protein
MKELVIPMNGIFQKNDDIVARKIADQMILVPIKGNIADMQRMFMLNPVGEFIWEHINGKCSVKEICDGIVNSYAVDQQKAEKDAFEFIGQLIDFQLIKDN